MINACSSYTCKRFPDLRIESDTDGVHYLTLTPNSSLSIYCHQRIEGAALGFGFFDEFRRLEAARYDAVGRIRCDMYGDAGLFFESLFHAVELSQSACEHDAVHLDIAEQLGRGVLEHVDDRVDDDGGDVGDRFLHLDSVDLHRAGQSAQGISALEAEGFVFVRIRGTGDRFFAGASPSPCR